MDDETCIYIALLMLRHQQFKLSNFRDNRPIFSTKQNITSNKKEAK